MKSTLFWRLALVILAIGVAHVPDAQASQKEDLRKLFESRDSNRDKRLSEHEFVGEKGGKARAKLRKQFRILDENGDTWLSWQELRKGHD